MPDDDDPTISPPSLVKFRVEFFIRTKGDGTWRTGDYSVQEVGVPESVGDDPGEIGRYIRDEYYDGDRETFVKVVGVERRDHFDAPEEPRESLPAKGSEEISAGRFKTLLDDYASGADSGREFIGRESVSLDWDNMKADAASVRKKLHAVNAPPGDYFWRASASGRGVHVRLPPYPEATPVYKVFDDRQQYRDDLKRTFLDLKRYLSRRDPHDAGGILFDMKGNDRAGPWHRLRLRR